MSRAHKKTTFDAQFGNRLRQFRLARGYSQNELGNALGITFQQVQKYEKGTNRISSTRVKTLCEVLQITPDQLYDIDQHEIKTIAPLSNYALRTALKLDKLSINQRRAITMLLATFGVSDE